ncbi:MAG: right-handed parallel beta-helix repeat-containing protein, partial [Salinivirgaceae bacterium]|nr:right-handed parallel beta-helix repeat-containing protein [Salinivirgaceae bacterium]
MKNKYLNIPVLISCFFLSFILSANATNYYVSALTGNNDNTGLSTSLAKRTIQAAANLTNPGDTVYIMNGNYIYTSYNDMKILAIKRSGEAGKYITYKAMKGHTPKLALSATATSQVWGCIEITASYIIIDGLELIGNNASLTYEESYKVWQDYEAGIGDWVKIAKCNAGGIGVKSHHIVVRNCKIHDCAGGIGAGNCDYVTIENNTIYNNCWYSMYAGSGISIFGPKDIDAVTGYKIFIRNNTVYNNKCLVPWEQIDKLSDGNGIILDANHGTQGMPIYVGRTLVQNNVSYNNGGGGIHAFQAWHVDIINNTAYNNGTVVGYPEIDANSCTDVNIYNNIMYARTGGNCNANDNAIYNYNIYYNGPAFKIGANDIVADPKFVAKGLDGTADFRLQSTSPAINSGSTTAGQFSTKDILGITRPQGSASDRGAYEVATVSNRTPENPSNTVNGLEYKYYEGTWSALPNFGNLSP